MKLTILIPCLNEEKTIGKVIDVAKDYLKNHNLENNSEILVSDNGSTDKSVKIAKEKKVRVVTTNIIGYGSAIRNGIYYAKGKYIIMGDADMSYDFANIDEFINKLDMGYDLVVGNRFKGGIAKGAMPLSHKIGSPILSLFANILFKTPIKDYHCGLRAFNKEKIKSLNLETDGMELASEMICKAKLNNLKMIEIPTKLAKDGRNGKSHLKTVKDGFRHLNCIIKVFMNNNSIK